MATKRELVTQVGRFNIQLAGYTPFWSPFVKCHVPPTTDLLCAHKGKISSGKTQDEKPVGVQNWSHHSGRFWTTKQHAFRHLSLCECGIEEIICLRASCTLADDGLDGYQFGQLYHSGQEVLDDSRLR